MLSGRWTTEPEAGPNARRRPSVTNGELGSTSSGEQVRNKPPLLRVYPVREGANRIPECRARECADRDRRGTVRAYECEYVVGPGRRHQECRPPIENFADIREEAETAEVSSILNIIKVQAFVAVSRVEPAIKMIEDLLRRQRVKRELPMLFQARSVSAQMFTERSKPARRLIDPSDGGAVHPEAEPSHKVVALNCPELRIGLKQSFDRERVWTSEQHVRLTVWRSTAGRFATRPLQRLASRDRLGFLSLHSDQDDSLVPEASHDLKRPSEGLDVPLERRNLAVREVAAVLQTRDIRLVHAGLLCDRDLRLAGRLSHHARRHPNTPGGSQTTAEHANWLGLLGHLSPSNLAHALPPLS